MLNVFKDVWDFMQIGHPDKLSLNRGGIGFPPPEVDKLCESLVKEEYEELRAAIEARDLTEVADSIADCIYVLIFTAHCHGIPIEEVWAEVQRTNMAKFPDGKVLRRESDGKILKPPGWLPPDVRGILRKYGAQL